MGSVIRPKTIASITSPCFCEEEIISLLLFLMCLRFTQTITDVLVLDQANNCKVYKICCFLLILDAIYVVFFVFLLVFLG